MQAIVAAENLAYCRQVIEKYFGAEIPVSHLDPDGACAIARACNLYAKHTGDYGPKVLAFAAASCLPGVEGGWDRALRVYPVQIKTSNHDHRSLPNKEE